MQDFIKWLLVVLLVLEVASKIACIGKQREPYTKELALGAFILNGLLVIAIIKYF